MSGLRGRLARLERDWKPDRFANVVEFAFSMGTEPLPEGTPVPDGAHVATDFFEDFTSPDWGSRKGVRFRSGYHRQRITFDPNDHGRVRPASEDPANSSLREPPPPIEPQTSIAGPDEPLHPVPGGTGGTG